MVLVKDLNLSWSAQAEAPFRADGGSEGKKGSCRFLHVWLAALIYGCSGQRDDAFKMQSCGLSQPNKPRMGVCQEQSQLCKLEFLVFGSAYFFLLCWVYSQPATRLLVIADMLVEN